MAGDDLDATIKNDEEPSFADSERTDRAAVPRSAQKRTVVLADLDETLLHSDPAPPVRASEPARLAGYRVHSRAGAGGMAEVRRASIIAGARPCVIKRLDPQFRDDPEYAEMFAEEARIAPLLRHPNIVECVEAGEDFISFELIEGMDLAEVIAARGALPARAVVEIGVRVAAALEYAHSLRDERGVELGLVHRDVSPENVLISWTGDVKLIDFGLSKLSGGVVTRVGVIKGKLSYLAPEQLAGAVVDARTDLFQLGVVLAEALVGRKLFSAVNAERPAELGAMVEAFLGGVGSARLRAVIGRLCCADPKDRYGSARLVGVELGRMVEQGADLVEVMGRLSSEV